MHRRLAVTLVLSLSGCSTKNGPAPSGCTLGCDDGDPSGDCLVDGDPCDDGDACTQLDTCSGGTCVGGDAVQCGSPAACHDSGVCDPLTGLCSTPASAATTACDDGNACTQSDACDGSGTCVGGDPVQCDAPETCHELGSCIPETGACTAPESLADTLCDDGDLTTYDDACDGEGACTGTPVECPTAAACTRYEPDGRATCVAVDDDGAACNDEDACTPPGVCNEGACDIAPPLECENGGTCADSACACPEGWTGPTCADDYDECAHGAPCGGGSQCSNSVGSYSCACVPNYSSPNGEDCTSTAQTLQLVIFYDEMVARRFASGTPAHVAQIFAKAKGLIETNLTSPQLTLSLEAVIALPQGTFTMRPCDTLDERGATSCTGCWIGSVPPADCSGAFSTSGQETDAEQLFTEFKTYAKSTHATALTALAGSFDVAVLLTERDLPASVVELSSLGGACLAPSGVAVIEARAGFTVDDLGVKLAHVVGHNLNMGHDGTTSSIMSSSAGAAASQFTTASLSAYTTYMGGSGGCLTTGADSGWASLGCGDGRIDPGEACDAGVAHDACCSATCQLEPGCACANTEPCCDDGALRGANTVCRVSTGECDLNDVCDGVSGACQFRVQSPGTSCTIDGSPGTCLRGTCGSRTFACRTFANNAQPTWTGCATSDRCDRTDCNGTSGTCNVWWNATAPDGVPCGADGVCVGGVCASSTTLHDYAWTTSAWSACGDGTQTRTRTCRDEVGAAAAEASCDAGNAPPTSRSCTP